MLQGARIAAKTAVGVPFVVHRYRLTMLAYNQTAEQVMWYEYIYKYLSEREPNHALFSNDT